MSNPSKQKGTAWETALVAWLSQNGFVHAERRALAGSNDRGDVTGIPGVCVEAKSCKRHELGPWLDETVQEAIAGADIPVLAVKRRGKGDPGDSFAIMRVSDLAALLVEAGYGSTFKRNVS